jgi:hypothetical protein
MVEPALENAKLERTGIVFLDLNEGGHNEVQVVVVPLLHVDDPPRSDERVLTHAGEDRPALRTVMRLQ